MIKIGFIGCGSISRTHVARLSLLEEGEAVVTGLCDVNRGNAEKLAKLVRRFRNISPENLKQKVFEKPEDMLDSLELDAVIVCTPHAFHYEHVMLALRRNLHVLVEKPMAVRLKDAIDMHNEAEKRGLVLAVGYQRHFQPEYLYARQVIGSGSLGDPHFILAWLSQDLRRAIGTRSWYLDPLLAGGGQLICSGTHLTDIVLWIVDSEPLRVKALMDKEGADVEMYISLSVLLANGALASISILGDSPEKSLKEEVKVWCSKGAVYIRDGRVWVQKKGDYLSEVPQELLPRKSPNPDVNFVRAIMGKEECMVPSSCGVNAAKLEEMAYEDAKPIMNNLRPAI